MNKTFLVIISCLLLTQITPAVADTTIELRSAAFFPLSQDFKRIYGSVGSDYEIQLTTTAFCCLDAWANFTWYPKHGKVGHCCGSSDLNIGNISIGLQKTCQLCDCFYIYGGIGPIFGQVWLDNRINCGSGNNRRKEKDTAFAVGGIVKTGIYYYFTCNCFVDIFADYFYEQAFFHHNVDVGGVRTGLGLGVSF